MTGTRVPLAFCMFLSAMFKSQEAAAPVPVEKEPLHHVVLKNDSVIVMHLSLQPGERTRYHTHSHDRVAIYLSANTITQQNWNEKEGSPSDGKPGDFKAITLLGDPLTHRVHNVGSSTFEVLDIEILRRQESSLPPATSLVAGENPSARVYKWVLAPGGTTSMHTHVRPYLIVAATGFNLKMTASDGRSFTHELKAGDFHWVDTKVTHTLGNAGAKEGQILEVELK